jgi:hypothetical protein
MSDFILILIGIFIIILIILIFTLLAYVYNTQLSYTIEINKNLSDSEKTINETNDAFNKLQDTVANNIATVKTNQEKILDNNKDYLNTLDSNLLKIMKIKNNNSNIASIISSNLDTSKSINIDFNNEITSYKNINALTNNNQYINVCNSDTDPIKRKCINMNIDADGIFNIYTKNNLATDPKSNIANIAIRDNNNNILASFNGSTNTISLGSDINPAISIKNNVYTPDIIVCNYTYIKLQSVNSIQIIFINNFDIKKDLFINILISNNLIVSIINNPANTYSNLISDLSINNNIIKFKTLFDIPKGTVSLRTFDITVLTGIDLTSVNRIKQETNGYVTAD